MCCRYDLLVEECKAIELGKELGCPRTALEQLTPLQLATKLGRKDMFRHILKRRVILVWQWGPEAEYRIPLDEIDSANSQGSLTVLELLVHPGDHMQRVSRIMDWQPLLLLAVVAHPVLRPLMCGQA